MDKVIKMAKIFRVRKRTKLTTEILPVNNKDITSKTTKMHTTRFIIAVYNTCFESITLSFIKLMQPGEPHV